jgi:hypothetical protein
MPDVKQTADMLRQVVALQTDLTRSERQAMDSAIDLIEPLVASLLSIGDSLATIAEAARIYSARNSDDGK